MRCDKNPKKFLRWKYRGFHNYVFKDWENYMARTGNYVNGEPVMKKMTYRKWVCSHCGDEMHTDHMRDIFG